MPPRVLARLWAKTLRGAIKAIILKKGKLKHCELSVISKIFGRIECHNHNYESQL